MVNKATPSELPLRKSAGGSYRHGGDNPPSVFRKGQIDAENTAYAAADITWAADKVGDHYDFGDMCYFSGLSGDYDQVLYLNNQGNSYNGATTTTYPQPTGEPCDKPAFVNAGESVQAGLVLELMQERRWRSICRAPLLISRAVSSSHTQRRMRRAAHRGAKSSSMISSMG